MPNDDTFLRVALHIDDCVDMDVMFVLLETLHHHLDRVRHLLIIVAQDLLTDDLRHEEAGRLVRQLVLAKVSRTLGQQFHDALHQHVGTELIGSRDRKYFRIGQQSVPLLHKVAQLRSDVLALQHVNLVDEQQHGNLHLPHFLQEVGVLLRLFYHVGDIQQNIRIGQSRLRELQHILLHLIVRLQHSRRVRKHNLTIVGVDDAHDAMTRGLRLESGNADLLADKLVHQRRLTHIGVSYNIYETGLMLHNNKV